MKRSVISGAVAATLLAAILAVVPWASASSSTFPDPRGDGGGSAEIRRVGVDYKPSRLTVLVQVRNVAKSGGINVYVDSNKKRRGPEFVLLGPISLGDYDWRVTQTGRGWRSTAIELLCGSDLRSSRDGDVVRVTFDRDCLRNPDTLNLRTGKTTDRTRTRAPRKVRISVQTTGKRGSVDWSPGVRKLHPPVSNR